MHRSCICIAFAFALHVYLHCRRFACAMHMPLHLSCICICKCCIAIAFAIVFVFVLAFKFFCTCVAVSFACAIAFVFAFVSIFVMTLAQHLHSLQLFCICICARIGQATKARCNGIRKDACQYIGSYWHAGLQFKLREQLLAFSFIMSRGFKKSRQAASQHVASTPKFVFVGRLRPPLTRLGYAFHAQPFWLGSRW